MLHCCHGQGDGDSRVVNQLDAVFNTGSGDPVAFGEDAETDLRKLGVATDGSSDVLQREIRQDHQDPGVVLVQRPLLQATTNSLNEIAALLKDIAVAEEPEQPVIMPPGLGRITSSGRQSYLLSKVTVGVHMVIERLFFLDNVAQKFGVQLIVVMEWELPPHETPPLPEEDDGDWEPMWTPKYKISLLMEEVNVEAKYSVKERNGVKWIVYEGHHLVNIFEQLELQQFPVDTQDLHIELVSVLPVNKVEWKPLIRDHPAVDLNEHGFHLTEVKLAEVPMTYGICSVTTLSGMETPALQAQVKVVRNSRFYALNVLAVIGCISGFALTSWSNHPADVGARLDVDEVLVLTAVAFKLVTTDMLPTVSYMTLMDKYIMSCFLFLGAVTTCHTVLPSFFTTHIENSVLTMPPWDSPEGEEDLIKADNISFYIFVAGYVLLQAFFITALTYLRHVNVTN
eukprot:CAMPEP_0178441106 /NCGR_PEP_ID=MMETSP0689_2-20121128/37274_1 /TAXON_ID=160604 /ORGANISM="Amphidinium massartii, Strain CS-259" /LENGTH=453 /DNA_ID=CAMNT_0020064203 /DNA_START=30 /DNA_END=1388 /DNA_ORIENTATION=-